MAAILLCLDPSSAYPEVGQVRDCLYTSTKPTAPKHYHFRLLLFFSICICIVFTFLKFYASYETTVIVMAEHFSSRIEGLKFMKVYSKQQPNQRLDCITEIYNLKAEEVEINKLPMFKKRPVKGCM